jgi:hypothetical protein
VAAVAVAALLWAPALFYDLTGYVTEPGQAGLFGSTLVWSVVAVGAVLMAAWLARTHYGWLSAAGAVVLAAPRFFIYDVTYLLVGADAGGTPSDSAMAHPRRRSQTRG